MSLEKQINKIREEVGKPRKDRGVKVRLAAIRFEEHFRGREFTSAEFDEWLANDPDMAPYLGKSSLGRKNLQQAGLRDDMEHPFEIYRTKKSAWILRPVEKIFFTDDIPQNFVDVVKATEKDIQMHLQA